MHDSTHSGLRPHIGLFGGTMLIVGSMIGSAIFFAPSIMAGINVDSPSAITSPAVMIGLWLLGGFFTIAGALSYAELAAMSPHAGGQYVYLREAFGPLCGFLYGWTLFLVIQSGFNAAVSIAFAKYLGTFLPSLGESNVLVHVPLFEAIPTLSEVKLPAFLMAARINSAQLVACAVIIVLTLINMLGVREGTLVQNVFTTLKILGLAALIIAGLSRIGSATENFQPFWPGPEFWTGASLAALAVPLSKALFAYDAWNTATFVAEEIENPRVNLPRSLMLGAGGVTAIYVLAVISYIVAVPLDQMGQIPENRVAGVAAQAFFGEFGVTLVIIAILISTFGCVNGLILTGARVIFAMAREGLFFRSCARLNPQSRSPTVALIYQAVWSCVLTLTGSYNDLLTYCTFASVLFGALTVVGLFRLRMTQPDRERPYRCWGYPVTPAIYLLIAIPFLVYVIWDAPKPTGIGIILVLSGLPMYAWLRKQG